MALIDWFKKDKVKTISYPMVESFRSIDIDKLTSVYSSDMSIIQIHSCCKNIIEYQKILQIIVNAFKYDILLYVTQLPQNIHQIYIRDFYIHDGFTIDVINETSQFITLATELLDLYIKQERSLERSFTIEKNLLLSQYVVANLNILSKELSSL